MLPPIDFPTIVSHYTHWFEGSVFEQSIHPVLTLPKRTDRVREQNC